MKRSIFGKLLALSCGLGLAFLLLGADLCLHLAGSSLAASERRVFASIGSRVQEVARLTTLGLLEPSDAGLRSSERQIPGAVERAARAAASAPGPVPGPDGAVLLLGAAPVGAGGAGRAAREPAGCTGASPPRCSGRCWSGSGSWSCACSATRAPGRSTWTGSACWSPSVLWRSGPAAWPLSCCWPSSSFRIWRATGSC